MSSSEGLKDTSDRLCRPTLGIFVHVCGREMDAGCSNVQVGTGVAVESIYYFCDSRESVD